VGFQPVGDGSQTRALRSENHQNGESNRDGASRTLGASDNLPAPRSNVDAGHGLVMSSKLVLQCKAVSGAIVKLDAGVTSDSKQVPIGAEGVVGDGLMEQQIDFGGGHDDDD
jgi:hypothetical protein